MKSITRNWDGGQLRETCLYYPKSSTVMRLRIITGLINGGGTNGVYVWGDNGWNFLICRDDISIDLGNTSYVSSEADRKFYAETLNSRLKDAVKQLFI